MLARKGFRGQLSGKCVVLAQYVQGLWALLWGGGSGCGALLGFSVWECGKALQPQLCVLPTPLPMRVGRCSHAEFPVIKEPGTAWGTGTHFTDEALVV